MPELSWEQIWGGIITVVLTTLVKVVFSFLKEQRDKHALEEQRKDEIINALMRNNQELIEWKSEIEARNIQIEQKLQSLGEQMKRITENDLILLKDKILHLCGFFITQGSITLAARENITEMYKCYQNMGGNGTGKLMYEQVMKLKVKDVILTEQEFLNQEVQKEMKSNGSKRKRKRKSIDTPESEK